MGRAVDLHPNVPRLGLNRSEVAAAIGVSVNTVDEMVKDGRLPPARRWHTRKIWLVAEIMAWMTEWPVDQGAPDRSQSGDGAGGWRASA
jgi:predicted DNA-binding transcriptional regulator AlpA